MTTANGLALRCKQLEDQLASVHESVVCAFNQMLDLKDLGTGVHSTRLAEWGVRLGRELGVDEGGLRSLEVAAVLHDIGKMGVPDAILHKSGRLTEDEWVVMRKHPEYGWAIVRLFPAMVEASLFILHHHERLDGAGYPARLGGAQIPLGSRIVAVIDAFDAMTSARPYRLAVPIDEAIRRLVDGKGTQFDPAVVDGFVRLALSEYRDVVASTGA